MAFYYSNEERAWKAHVQPVRRHLAMCVGSICSRNTQGGVPVNRSAFVIGQASAGAEKGCLGGLSVALVPVARPFRHRLKGGSFLFEFGC